jgi:hypothetical protein
VKKPTVRVTVLVNRILWPRLRELGFRLKHSDSDRWAEGSVIERSGPHGRGQGLLMGRDKFGHAFGVMASRELPDGSWDYLDLKRAGLPAEEQRYENTAEANVVLRRIADIVTRRMVPWLDEDPPVVSSTTARHS